MPREMRIFELSDIIGSEFNKVLDIFENLLDKAYNTLQ